MLRRFATRNDVKRGSAVGLAVGIGGLLMIVASAVFISGQSPFPGALALMPTLGAALLIAAPANPIRKAFSNNIAVFIGEISYSLYLWHWPVIVLTKYYYATETLNALQTVGVIAGAFALSIASYYLIERPLRRTKWPKVLGITIATGCVIGAAVVLTVPLLAKKTNGDFYSPLYLSSHAKYSMGVAELGDTAAPPSKIFFTGDSHANFMKTYLDVLGKAHGFNVRTITNDAWPLIPAIEGATGTYNKLLPTAMDEMQKADIIILQWAGDGQKESAGVEQLAHGLKPSQTLVILSPVLTLDRDPMRINRDIVRDRSKTIDYETSQTQPVERILEIAHSNPQVVYLDLTGSPAFADAPFHRDTLMYYDAGHLNRYGAEVYARYTGDRFMRVLDSIRNEEL